jgi:hypothetical protein
MQTSGLGSAVDTAVEAAISSSEREFVIELKADWLRNGTFAGHPFSDLSALVDEVSVDRSLSGSAPAELMLIEGSAAAELSFTVAGEYTNPQSGIVLQMPGVFSPFNGQGPFFQINPVGAEIRFRIGVETPAYGTVWYDQFIGNVRTVTPNRASNAVKITALDRSEILRQPVYLPTWATSRWSWDRGYQVAQLAYSHWVIDHCLKGSNVSTSPLLPKPDEEGGHLQFWLSGNGSIIPSIGVFDNARVSGFPKTETNFRKMYGTVGEAHPLVKAEADSTGKAPQTLDALTSDASGVVPTQMSSLASVGITQADAGRSYHLAYRAADLPRLTRDQDGTHWVGFTMPCRGPNDSWWQTTAEVVILEAYVGFGLMLQVLIQTGSVRAVIRRWATDFVEAGTSWINIPTGQDSVNIRAAITHPSSTTNDRRIGVMAGTNTSGYAIVANYGGSFAWDSREGLFHVNHKVAMQDVFWSNHPLLFNSFDATMISNYSVGTADYAAVLDRGKNMLTHTPQTMYDDGWDLLSSVASAEFGSVFWDEKGIFRFWNRDTLQTKQNTIVKKLTLDDASDLQITNSVDSVRNVISVDTTRIMADEDVVFDSSDVDAFAIGPLTNFNKPMSMSNIMAVSPGLLPQFSTVAENGIPAWNDNTTGHGYIVEWFNGSNWTESHFVYPLGIEIWASTDGHGNVNLRFHNGYNAWARVSKMRIQGTKVNSESNQVRTFRDFASSSYFGQRNLPISGDWAQQQPDTIEELGEFLLGRTVNSIPTTDDIVVAGDPRLQLGDCVVVDDPYGFGENIKLQTLGISRTFSANAGLEDKLTIEMIAPNDRGIWDSQTYGSWDTSFRWSD